MEDLSVDINKILKKWCMKVWFRFNCLRTGSNGKFLWPR